MKQQDHQAERILIGFCVAAYFVSYITRINYGTVLLKLSIQKESRKMSASMAVTGSFVTYGVGQLISGWLGDRIKPRYLMFIGLMISAGMNICVPLFSRPAEMLVFWCINGFAQALMWPPMVRLLSDYLDQDTYKKSCVWVSWGIFCRHDLPLSVCTCLHCVERLEKPVFPLCRLCSSLCICVDKSHRFCGKKNAEGFCRELYGGSCRCLPWRCGNGKWHKPEENTSALQKQFLTGKKPHRCLRLSCLQL